MTRAKTCLAAFLSQKNFQSWNLFVKWFKDCVSECQHSQRDCGHLWCHFGQILKSLERHLQPAVSHTLHKGQTMLSRSHGWEIEVLPIMEDVFLLNGAYVTETHVFLPWLWVMKTSLAAIRIMTSFTVFKHPSGTSRYRVLPFLKNVSEGISHENRLVARALKSTY